MKNRTPKKVRIHTFLIFFIGIVISGIGILANEEAVLCMTGIAVMFVSIIHHVIFYRCPHCGRFLDRSTGEFCPHCGEKVNE